MATQPITHVNKMGSLLWGESSSLRQMSSGSWSLFSCLRVLIDKVQIVTQLRRGGTPAGVGTQRNTYPLEWLSFPFDDINSYVRGGKFFSSAVRRLRYITRTKQAKERILGRAFTFFHRTANSSLGVSLKSNQSTENPHQNTGLARILFA